MILGKCDKCGSQDVEQWTLPNGKSYVTACHACHVIVGEGEDAAEALQEIFANMRPAWQRPS
jgi:hypothetical protein